MKRLLSAIHPLSLILIVVWLSSMALITLKLISLATLIGISISMMILLSRDHGKKSLLRLSKLLPLLIFVTFMQVIFRRGGTVLFAYKCFAITSLGLGFGLAISLRFAIIISGASILSSLSFVDFRNAFALIRLPEEISFMVSYVLRFVSTLRQRFDISLSMLKLRGIDLEKQSLIKRLKIYRILALSVMVNALSHSSLQAIALELRGFRSSGKRTELYLTKPEIIDAFILWGLVILSLFVV
jgi:energy-coupling factor transport system permease protein